MTDADAEIRDEPEHPEPELPADPPDAPPAPEPPCIVPLCVGARPLAQQAGGGEYEFRTPHAAVHRVAAVVAAGAAPYRVELRRRDGELLAAGDGVAECELEPGPYRVAVCPVVGVAAPYAVAVRLLAR